MLNISFVYSAVLKFEGQMSVFNYPPNVGPTYRDFLPEPPNPNDIPSCAEGGVVGGKLSYKFINDIYIYAFALK